MFHWFQNDTKKYLASGWVELTLGVNLVKLSNVHGILCCQSASTIHLIHSKVALLDFVTHTYLALVGGFFLGNAWIKHVVFLQFFGAFGWRGIRFFQDHYPYSFFQITNIGCSWL